MQAAVLLINICVYGCAYSADMTACYLLLPVIAQVVKVKGLSTAKGCGSWSHYFTIISRLVMSSDEGDRVDSVILGIDIRHNTITDTAADGGASDGIIDDDDDDDDGYEEMMNGEESVATVGLVLPITSSLSVTTAGQGYVKQSAS